MHVKNTLLAHLLNKTQLSMISFKLNTIHYFRDVFQRWIELHSCTDVKTVETQTHNH